MYDELKGIFIDSNNIFLWHESEDINIKSLLPKFQLIPILRLQVMHDYVHWYCSIGYCVKLSLIYKTLCKKLSSFHKEIISALFLWGNVLLRGELQIDAINSNLYNFENTLYMKAVSITSSAHSTLFCGNCSKKNLLCLFFHWHLLFILLFTSRVSRKLCTVYEMVSYMQQ